MPLGNVPTTRVCRRISRFIRSITLLVRMRVQCSRKIAVGQSFLNAVLDLLGSLLQFHGAQSGNDRFSLVAGRLFALLRVDHLEHFCHNFDLGFGHNRENIAVEMHLSLIHICAAKGFKAGSVRCGVKESRLNDDTAIIFSECECTAAATYTMNRVKAAPLYVTMEHLEDGVRCV